MAERAHEVVVVRHGETPWALEGRHTGRTDVPLTDRGRREAEMVGDHLRGRPFGRVLASPLQRALETCRRAGFGDVAQICNELVEWDYGAYEGRTTPDIVAHRPGWSLWADGVPGGETVDEVGHRADRVIAEARLVPGDVLIFAHGHVLRILAARWLGLAAVGGRYFRLDPSGMGILGFEHTSRVLVRWNEMPDEHALATEQGG